MRTAARPCSLPVSILTALLLVSSWTPAQETESAAPDWAQSMGLFLTGGPPSVPVEVIVNGRSIAKVDQDSPNRLEVASALRGGVNEVQFVYRHDRPGTAPPRRAALSLSVYEKQGTRNLLVDTLAETVIPAEPLSGPCTETYRFWGGPVPPSTGLNKRYWLFVNGPMIGYRVDIIVGDTTVFTATSGERVFEITPWLVRGKNVLRYEAQPICAGDPIAEQGTLKLIVSPGRIGKAGFEFDGPSVGYLELQPPREPAPFVSQDVVRVK